MTITVLNSNIIDVNQDTFQTEVVERSYNTPVVVDFWAEWCGPCRSLGPILESLADEFGGKFLLAKVDVDQNQTLSQQYGVQGIPAVKAFVEGKVVGEFTGAQPEPRVREFLEGLIPTQADAIARQGYTWEMSEQWGMAVTHYQEALKHDPDHHPAMVGLGRTLMKQGQIDEAVAILQKIPQGTPEWPVADALIGTASFQQYIQGRTEADLQAELEADSKNIEARYALACLYAVEQNFEQALPAFLTVVQQDKTYADGGARKAMLNLFTAIGAEHPLTQEYQRKLGAALF